jgi:DNA-directed RNA polymerase subunit L
MISKETEKELELVFENEKPTVFLLLKEELDKRPEVVICAWREEHPLTKKVYFYIRTDGSKKPREVLLEAIQSALKRVDSFEKTYKKVVKL